MSLITLKQVHGLSDELPISRWNEPTFEVVSSASVRQKSDRAGETVHVIETSSEGDDYFASRSLQVSGPRNPNPIQATRLFWHCYAPQSCRPKHTATFAVAASSISWRASSMISSIACRARVGGCRSLPAFVTPEVEGRRLDPHLSLQTS
jgi:hypothetical protein